MEVEQKLPQRKTPRAQWIEYNTGIYFVTVCTQNFIHYFGEISNGEITCDFSFIKIILLSLHLKNHQNFKGEWLINIL